MVRMTLAVHTELYSIHSLEPTASIPTTIFEQPLYFIGKTKEELSIVVPADVQLNSQYVEHNWRCFEVMGPLDFSMTGILSNISGTLAAADISIFAISTFDTDYILVKRDKLSLAISSLNKNNYHIVEY